MTPNDKELKAILSLRNNKDWNVVLEWLERERISALEDSIQIEDVLSRWAQGQAWFIGKFLGKVKDAENIRKKNKAEKEIKHEGFVA